MTGHDRGHCSPGNVSKVARVHFEMDARRARAFIIRTTRMVVVVVRAYGEDVAREAGVSKRSEHTEDDVDGCDKNHAAPDDLEDVDCETPSVNRQSEMSLHCQFVFLLGFRHCISALPFEAAFQP